MKYALVCEWYDWSIGSKEMKNYVDDTKQHLTTTKHIKLQLCAKLPEYTFIVASHDVWLMRWL